MIIRDEQGMGVGMRLGMGLGMGLGVRLGVRLEVKLCEAPAGLAGRTGS